MPANAHDSRLFVQSLPGFFPGWTLPPGFGFYLVFFFYHFGKKVLISICGQPEQPSPSQPRLVGFAAPGLEKRPDPVVLGPKVRGGGFGKAQRFQESGRVTAVGMIPRLQAFQMGHD